MQAGDRVTIPYPIIFRRIPSLPNLHGREAGVYITALDSGLGETFHKIVINETVYLLREGEFTKSEEL